MQVKPHESPSTSSPSSGEEAEASPDEGGEQTVEQLPPSLIDLLGYVLLIAIYKKPAKTQK